MTEQTAAFRRGRNFGKQRGATQCHRRSCETLPSTAAPQTVTRLGVGLGQSRRNEEERTQKQEGTTRGDVDIKRAMGDVLTFVLWLSISFGLFTLTIKWTGKNAIEGIKDYIRSCVPMEYIGLKLN
ncbi:hypothetical protein MHU86_18444 [Fragilaria crotonensis]|nr:hypothetical protein MHU86_18444 [Fragilaria crotonensis]